MYKCWMVESNSTTANPQLCFLNSSAGVKNVDAFSAYVSGKSPVQKKRLQRLSCLSGEAPGKKMNCIV